MGIKYANNATTQIVAALTSSDDTVTLSPGDGNKFPSLASGDFFIATLVNNAGEFEIVKAVERSGDTVTIERAQEGTLAKAFSIGSRFELRLTAGAFEEIVNSIRSEAIAAISTVADTIVPIGGIIIMPGNFVPPNYIRPNGAVLSRADYSRLWSFANSDSSNIVNESAWGSNPACFSRGDGSTTFRIPDLRGEFIRFWDEGRGVDAGRAFASVQDSQNLSHTHSAWDNGHNHGINDPGHNHHVNDPGHRHWYDTVGGAVGIQGGLAAIRMGAQGTNTSSSGTGIWNSGSVTGISIRTGNASIVVGASGGNESRPRNVAYLPLMRYQ